VVEKELMVKLRWINRLIIIENQISQERMRWSSSDGQTIYKTMQISISPTIFRWREKQMKCGNLIIELRDHYQR